MAAKPILVLVTMQRACARLIRTGADMALIENRPLLVLHVAGADGGAQPAIDAQVLDFLYALAGENGAEMSVIASDVPVTAMANFAQAHEAGKVLLGAGELADGIAKTLCELLPGVPVQVLDEDATVL